VQPGKSFHDVEEVYTSESPRLAISGWFHVPQEGEPGYTPADPSIEEKALSSLEQLTTVAEDQIWSFSPLGDMAEYDFTEDDLEFLAKWINETYLTPDVVEQMHDAMTEESLLELPDFLNPTVSKALLAYLTQQDKSAGREGWQIAGPPHKQRFRYTRTSLVPEHNLIELFEHPAFRKWLYHATGLEVTSQRAIARHFRPGSDYTLATEHTTSVPNLEATLCLTPSAKKVQSSTKAKGIGARAALANRMTGWENGEFGGYEVYLAPNLDEEADPAVYKATEEGDDGVLMSRDAAWNYLTLAVRDQGTLKFVKYVSRAAWGGRWDVTSEWTTKEDEDGDEEDGSEDGGEASI
jgi:prolyl 3-hydroxylase /prolyl 3,4-dihydroxylase